eukprot:369354-Alexandrium_andersonii.AAC.1
MARDHPPRLCVLCRTPSAPFPSRLPSARCYFGRGLALRQRKETQLPEAVVASRQAVFSAAWHSRAVSRARRACAVDVATGCCGGPVALGSCRRSSPDAQRRVEKNHATAHGIRSRAPPREECRALLSPHSVSRRRASRFSLAARGSGVISSRGPSVTVPAALTALLVTLGDVTCGSTAADRFGRSSVAVPLRTVSTPRVVQSLRPPSGCSGQAPIAGLSSCHEPVLPLPRSARHRPHLRSRRDHGAVQSDALRRAVTPAAISERGHLYRRPAPWCGAASLAGPSWAMRARCV